MTEDFASVANFIMKNVGTPAEAQDYYENVKDGCKLPAIYFPQPETTVNKSVITNRYSFDNLLFVQVFHLTDDDALALANDIVTAFFEENCYIPLIKEDGTESGTFLHIHVDKIRRIEECVAQIQLSWKYNRDYVKDGEPVNSININLNSGG